MPGTSAVRAGRYAVIDLGTVTCRMLVADVDACGALSEIRREYAIVNLGEGVDAANKDELIARLAQEGVELRIIPGEAEARLSFSGASMDFPGEDLLVVDVGGGSTEIVAGRGGQAPSRSRSFNVGCRRMTERFLKGDPPTADELQRAEAWVECEMAPYFNELRADGFSWSRLIAVAGTATTVVSVHEAMERYDSAKVHGYEVSSEVLSSEGDRLAALPLAQRRQVAGVDSYTASETDILQGVALAIARDEMP